MLHINAINNTPQALNTLTVAQYASLLICQQRRFSAWICKYSDIVRSICSETCLYCFAVIMQQQQG